ncbi:MAG: hypothetical protein AAFP90_22615, partial [Planctomycetota bacterium]
MSPSRSKRGDEAVIISSGNWIEFVVVTPGTAQRQSKDCLGCGRDDVVQFVEPHFFKYLVRDRRSGAIGWSRRQKTSGRNRHWFRRGNLVASDLP